MPQQINDLEQGVINREKPDFLDLYLQFKENCMKRKRITDSDEIIKLFEIWLKQPLNL